MLQILQKNVTLGFASADDENDYDKTKAKIIEEAKKMLLEMQQFTNEKPSKVARMHLVFLKGTYLVDTEEWDSELADIKVDISDLNVSIRSQYHFLEGMKAFSKGNVKQLDSMMDNKINIQFLQKQVEKMLSDIEKLKDADREIVYQNGNGTH